jgi:hypothetical protein
MVCGRDICSNSRPLDKNGSKSGVWEYKGNKWQPPGFKHGSNGGANQKLDEVKLFVPIKSEKALVDVPNGNLKSES